MHTFGFGAIPMLFVWLFWVALVTAVIVLIVRLAGGGSGADRSDAP